jgi:hypothetical protein
VLEADISAQIRKCVDGGAAPVSLAEITERATAAGRPLPHRPVKRRSWLGISATGLAAAGIAAGLVVSQIGGAPNTTAGPRHADVKQHAEVKRAALDAATLKHLASASRSAMSTSGRVLISYNTTGDPSGSFGQPGSINQAGTDDYAFDGSSWRDSSYSKQVGYNGSSAINEFVGGQYYGFFPINSPKPQWEHAIGPDAKETINVPDPRTLLGVLSLRARFVGDGYTTVGGIRVEHLRATTPGNVSVAMLGQIALEGGAASRVASLDLWVDASGVVRQATAAVTAPQTITAQNGTHTFTMTTVDKVDFVQIGQPQHLTAPTSFITVVPKG